MELLRGHALTECRGRATSDLASIMLRSTGSAAQTATAGHLGAVKFDDDGNGWGLTLGHKKSTAFLPSVRVPSSGPGASE